MAGFIVDRGFPASRVHVIPYGVELTADGARTEHDVLVVGVAANLEYWKGLDVLLEAGRLVKSPLRLEIFGAGSLRDQLELCARDYGLDAHFHGFVADFNARLRNVDVLVQPSRADNLPLAVLEAMARGVPVIGTRVGGIPELIGDGETGMVVPPESPTALASALDTLARDPERRIMLGKQGRKRIAGRFSAGEIARQTVLLYRKLCESST
jgi:glycosyltransferase involved in cell wall biosynthesis